MKARNLALMLLCAATPVAAADLEPVPAVPVSMMYDWTGVYVGAFAGMGIANVTATASLGPASATATEQLKGVVAGGLVGGNIQFGQAVFGLELDYSWSNQSYSGTTLGLRFTDTLSQMATLRARLGFASGNTLYYVTAGSAAFQFNTEASAGIFTVSDSFTRQGWAIGGGFENAFTPSLVLRVEALYLQANEHKSNVLGVTVTESVSDTVARIGLLYKFGGGYVPVR